MEALEAKVTAERRQKVLEGQLTAQEMLRTSRLGFVTEVWTLHKMLVEAGSSMQITKGRTPTEDSRSLASKGAVAGNLQRMTCIRKRSKFIIDKYFTDDEKLHLGIPLALYEGGHNSSRPM